MKALWMTDIHLNFVKQSKRIELYNEIILENPDCIFITGDIGEAQNTSTLLMEMQQAIKRAIYFVAGNHDYYNGSIAEMREMFIELRHHQITYVTATIGFLSKNTMLVGVDGFADGRYGDYENTPVVLNDSRLIDEYRKASNFVMDWREYSFDKKALLKEMQKWARKDAAALWMQLIAAKVQKPKNIIILTHVPPFAECCTYKGRLTGPDYLPFYTCKRTGMVIDNFAKENPDIKILVLCGHTHDKATYERGSNLKVMVGGAEYNYPGIQCEIEYD